MSVHEEKYLDFCAAYVLGALDGNELIEFELHITSGCRICADEITDLAKVSGLLAALIPPASASPEVKERILFSVRLSKVAKGHIEERTEKYLEQVLPEVVHEQTPKPNRSWLPLGITAVAIVMVVAFSLYVKSLMGTIDEQQNFIATQQRHITLLKTKLEQKEAVLSVLESRTVSIVKMDGLTPSPFGYGKMMWDSLGNVAILQIANLPAVPAGKEYQVWMIKGQEKISVGLFSVPDKEHDNYFKVELVDGTDTRGINAFAVTLEPKGGVPQPTGEMYLLGKTVAN